MRGLNGVQIAASKNRLANAARGDRDRPARWWSAPIGVLYRVWVDWSMGIELPWRTRVGPGLRLQHGFGLVVHDNARIGARVTLRQGVTIGVARDRGLPPLIGDDVDVGAGAVILGEINVGDGAIIGAGSVVIESVPPMAVVVGNLGRVARFREQRSEEV